MQPRAAWLTGEYPGKPLGISPLQQSRDSIGRQPRSRWKKNQPPPKALAKPWLPPKLSHLVSFCEQFFSIFQVLLVQVDLPSQEWLAKACDWLDYRNCLSILVRNNALQILADADALSTLEIAASKSTTCLDWLNADWWIAVLTSWLTCLSQETSDCSHKLINLLQLCIPKFRKKSTHALHRDPSNKFHEFGESPSGWCQVGVPMMGVVMLGWLGQHQWSTHATSLGPAMVAMVHGADWSWMVFALPATVSKWTSCPLATSVT